jgi:hypothetical protein
LKCLDFEVNPNRGNMEISELSVDVPYQERALANSLVPDDKNFWN